MVRATIVYLFVSLYILLMSPIAILYALVTKDTTLPYSLARFCIRVAGSMSRIRVRIRGREKILPGQTYLFLSNHQANLDGPLLTNAIPRDIRALIKKEMMRIPIFSILLRQVGFVPIDRKDPPAAWASINEGARRLARGYSFIAFPEGTRSRDGRLGEFKKGAFVMALKARIPIMPVTVLNTREVQPPGTYFIRPGQVEVIFHDPIPTNNLTLDDRNQLAEMTRAAIASALPEAAGSR